MRILLLPISLIYHIVLTIRHKLYDWHILRTTRFEKPLICVGNLNLGGTGKTPHTEYLINVLKDHYRVATLSRGYGRKTKGFKRAETTSTYEDLGDEPLQYFKKFPEIQVAVDEDRVNGVRKLLMSNNASEIILLDDAFQHRSIKAGLNILLTEYQHLYCDDLLFPAGTLRDVKSAARRANLIVVSKSPKELKEAEKQQIINKLKPSTEQKVYFSYLEYAPLQPLNEKAKTTTLRINSKEEKAEVKANQVLYLQRVGQADKIYKFKEMKLANYPDNNIYVQLNNKAITDQLSFTSWEYPDLDELFKNLGDIVSHIYTILFFSIALFKMHLNNEYNYLQLSASLEALSISYGSSSSEIMPKFHGVFTSYGGFEVGTTNSRFALYIIALFIILLSMLKRMFFGGYSRPILVLIVFILSVVFILENIIYGILSLLMIVFSILSVVCYYDMNKGSEAVLDEMIQAKLYIQMILNVIIFSLCMKILSLNAKLTSALNQLRKEVNHLYDGTPSEEQENIKGFQYKGLDGQEHVLNELKIEGHPRYVYYTMYNDINNVHENRAILPNDSSGRNESNINTNNIHIEVRPNQPVVSASGPAQTIHVRPNQSVVPASGPAQSIQDMMIENGNLRETNRKLNEELNRLRSNLANLYNSINNNM